MAVAVNFSKKFGAYIVVEAVLNSFIYYRVLLTQRVFLFC